MCNVARVVVVAGLFRIAFLLSATLLCYQCWRVAAAAAAVGLPCTSCS